MKYNAINLIRFGADALRARGDTGTAYALHELANNLLQVMHGEASLEEWNGCYTAQRCEVLDLDKHLPEISVADTEEVDKEYDEALADGRII